jgi:hypothetical protein
MTSMLVTRGIIVVLSLALAIALIARGNVLIGVLIGALAVTRLVMFVRLGRRRERFRRLHERRTQNGGAPLR